MDSPYTHEFALTSAGMKIVPRKIKLQPVFRGAFMTVNSDDEEDIFATRSDVSKMESSVSTYLFN